MDINELTALQESFDREHGWGLKSDNLSELLDMLHKDLIGLLGELGEFANNLKKVTLVHDRSGTVESNKLLEESKKQLREELVDTLIYVIRIAAHLNIDIEKEYLEKLEYNKRKYQEYET